jgi:SAM-dependent methyltransferase
MAEYDVLANFYDELMVDADYESICSNLELLFDRFGSKPELVLDLGCGTGGVALALAKRGYDMIGVDLSSAMLSIAAQKECSTKVLWLLQDMASLDLYGTVDAAVCCMDGINHLTAPEKVRRCMNRVSLFLNPSGLFIFDLITPFQFSSIFANGCFVLESERAFCAWQSRYSKRSRKCRHSLSVFERVEDGCYKRHDDEILERSYEVEEIKGMLKSAGLRFLGAYDAGTLKRVGPKSARIYVVAQKPENGERYER